MFQKKFEMNWKPNHLLLQDILVLLLGMLPETDPAPWVVRGYRSSSQARLQPRYMRSINKTISEQI